MFIMEHPASRPAAAKASPRHDPALDSLRARMDEVRYEAGHPNVLTMTRFVRRDDARDRQDRRRADARGARGAAARGRGGPSATFRRVAGDRETVLALGGVLDVVTVSELQPLFERALADEGPTIVLDVASLRRIDSSGVVAIVALTREARASGRVVRVRGLEGQPLDVFRLFRLDLMLDLDDGPPAHAAS